MIFSHLFLSKVRLGASGDLAPLAHLALPLARKRVSVVHNDEEL
jgi:histidine ammonia-lyase